MDLPFTFRKKDPIQQEIEDCIQFMDPAIDDPKDYKTKAESVQILKEAQTSGKTSKIPIVCAAIGAVGNLGMAFMAWMHDEDHLPLKNKLPWTNKL